MTIHNLQEHLDWYLRTQPIFPPLDHIVALIDSPCTLSPEAANIFIPDAEKDPTDEQLAEQVFDDDFGTDDEMARLQLAPITSARKSRIITQAGAKHLPFPVPTRPSPAGLTLAPVVRSTKKPEKTHSPAPPPYDDFDFGDAIDVDDIEELDMMDGLEDHASSATIEKFGEPRRLWREDSASRVEPLSKRGKKRTSDEFGADIPASSPSRREKRGKRLVSPEIIREASTKPVDLCEEYDLSDFQISFSPPPSDRASLSEARRSPRRSPAKANISEVLSPRMSETPSRRHKAELADERPEPEGSLSKGRLHQKLEISDGKVENAELDREALGRPAKSVLVHASSPCKEESPSPETAPKLRRQHQLSPQPKRTPTRSALGDQVQPDSVRPGSARPVSARPYSAGPSSALPGSAQGRSTPQTSTQNNEDSQKVLQMPRTQLENALSGLQTTSKKVVAERVGYVMEECEVPADLEAKHRSIRQQIKALTSITALHQSYWLKVGEKEDIKKRLITLMDVEMDDGDTATEIGDLRKKIPPLNAELEGIKASVLTHLESGVGALIAAASASAIKSSNTNTADPPNLPNSSSLPKPDRSILVAATQAPKTHREPTHFEPGPSTANVRPTRDALPTHEEDPSFQGFDDESGFSRNMGEFDIAEDFEVDDDLGLFEAAENQLLNDHHVNDRHQDSHLESHRDSHSDSRRQPLRDTSGNTQIYDPPDKNYKLPGTPYRSALYVSPGPVDDPGTFEPPNPYDLNPYDPGLSPAKPLLQYTWSAEVKAVLKQTFKLRGFRRNQLEAINATLNGEDAFVLMPTGGGKSLCYQLPAVVQTGKTRGVTLVISPLLSLMNDQVTALQSKGVQACMINGNTDQEQRAFIMTALRSHEVERLISILYITPEMINNSGAMGSLLRQLNARQKLARIVIDEAHCVSQWGHDFRPDYIALGDIRREYAGVPVIALTATATENVKADVMHNLGMTGCQVFSQSFNRPNLSYIVLDKKTHTAGTDIIDKINTHHKSQTGIVYCLSRKSCESFAQKLRHNQIKAEHYHAGIESKEKDAIQQRWQSGQTKVIVATIAFGMGIDKADVRFVFHYSLPKSLEGYYQETGRAGRDGKSSSCYLYYGYGDTQTFKRMIKDSEGSHEQKERQYMMLRHVVEFCENKSDCRRVQILAYFSEQFRAEECNGCCDICKSGTKFKSHDFSSLAASALKMVKQIRDQVTLLHCVDVFRGARNKKITDLRHDQLDEYGLASDLDRGDVERLFRRLLIEGGLGENNQVNRMGFATQYVHLGHNSHAIISGRYPIVIHVKDSSVSKLKVISRKTAKTTGVRASIEDDYPMSTNVSSPLQQKRPKRKSMAKIAEDSDDAFEPPQKARALGPPIRQDRALARLSDPHRRALETFMIDAKKLCDNIILSKGIKRPPFSDTLLRKMAIELPSSVPELASIAGINADAVERYGTQILNLVQIARADRDAMVEAQDFDHDPNHQNVVEISDDDFVVPDDEEDEEDTSEYFSSRPEPPQLDVATFNANMYRMQAESAASRAKEPEPKPQRNSSGSWRGRGRGRGGYSSGSRSKAPRNDGKKKKPAPNRKSRGSNGSSFFSGGRGGTGGSRGGGGGGTIGMMPI